MKLLVLTILPFASQGFLSIESSITGPNVVPLYSSSFQSDQKDGSSEEVIVQNINEGFHDLLRDTDESFPSTNVDSTLSASRVVGPKQVLIYDTSLRGKLTQDLFSYIQDFLRLITGTFILINYYTCN